ncbi:ABC transporter ATP-binding protein [Neorickettsia sennetsu]|uniref:ABC transporter, ATP-binding protein n=1 Tax=Ehrlichia sennetsu (strain ATCC VR-367 / Miyayama) TaxID=222891 RepID=Q2GDT2_EHRS3|nr:ABC transporter ATP-binding protein [Neorickettsia sennetsu]ABD45862.1 ABC transporter, ATP-binding protein [Neorickettsia sennetsu str. Miyayama]
MSLSLKDVSHCYEHFSIEKACFECSRGEIVCLVGESGSGKSTLLRLIAGLENPFFGTIKILDRKVFDHVEKISVPTENRNIAMIFQHSSLFPNKTVLENVRFALKKTGRGRIAEEMIELVGMTKYSAALPFQISGGQQQLVTLARAFAQFPDILLLDEPFSNLDTSLRTKIREDMISLISSKNLTTVIVTHDPYEALEISDTIVVIDEGRVVMQGVAEEVYYNPPDKKTAELFGIINVIEGQIINNKFCCDFGSHQLEGEFPDIERKNAYVRPCGIRVCFSGEGREATVCKVRSFSKMFNVELSGKSYWVQGSVDILPKKYDKISLRLDHKDLIFFD